MNEALRRTMLVCLLGATACGCAGGGGSPAAPSTTSQAVVFDAAADRTVGVFLSYSPAGVRLETGDGGHTCPPNAHVAPGGLAAFDPEAAGLGGFPVPLGAAFSRAAAQAPAPDFGLPDALESDCDVSEAFPEVAAWLDAATREADAVVADLETCASAAEVLYCEIVRRVEAAETSGYTTSRDDLPLLFGPGQQGRPLPDPAVGGCSAYVVELDGVAPLLDALRFDRARCEDVLEVMQSVIDATGEAHDAGEKARRLAAADGLLHEAGGYLESGRLLAARLHRARALFDAEDVKASCAACEPVGAYRRPPPVGNVRVRWDAQALAPVAAAVAEAVGRERDPLQQAGLEALAARLRQVDASRILRVSFAGRSRIGTDYVALADPVARTDEAAPHVIVLSVLPAGTDLPEPNTADLRLLHEACRLFVEALAGNADRVASPR